MASGDTHQRGCLVQCHVLSEQTVQNLKSGLFFLSQCHILHEVNMTFMLASSADIFAELRHVNHLGVPSVYTTPGGRDWYKTPAAPDTTRISYGQSKRSIGGLDVSFNVETLLQGPSS